MSPPWNTSKKTITNIASTQPNPADQRIPASFVPPQILGHLDVKPHDLFLSMARCAALSSVSPSLHIALEAASRSLLEVLVDDASTDFDLQADVRDLVDFERSSLAGRVGAGFTDLVMMFLGYNWRDLASAQIKNSPLADFLYEGGPAAGHGAILTEAKGSFAASTTAATIRSTAESGYANQVDPNLGASCAAGQVIYGYAVAFGAQPSSPTSNSWAGIHIAEAKHPALPGLAPVIAASSPATSGATPAPTGGGAAPARHPSDDVTKVSWRTALGNFRSMAVLIGAVGLYAAISDLLADRAPSVTQSFLKVRSGDRSFLVADGPNLPAFRFFFPQIFAIDEEVAEQFLLEMSREATDGRREFLFLTTAPTTLGADYGEQSPYILFPDGLAMLLEWRETHVERPWSLVSGLEKERPSSRPPDIFRPAPADPDKKGGFTTMGRSEF